MNVELLIKETGEIQRQRVYMGDYPWMTDMGTFVINGAERVVVSQLVRSPGVYYSELEDPASGRMLFSAKVIPNRGTWLEFETNNKDRRGFRIEIENKRVRLFERRHGRPPGMDLEDTRLHQADQPVQVLDAAARPRRVLRVGYLLDAAAQPLPGMLLEEALRR